MSQKVKSTHICRNSLVRDLTIAAFPNKYTFFSYILTVGVPKSNGEKIKGGVDIYLGKEGVNGQGG